VTLAEEIKGMLRKSRRYLNSAEILRRNEDFDSAVSRLYYAMFYGAEALLLAKGKTFSSHRAVVSAFGEFFIKTGLFPKEMHQWLHRAFEKRQISEYDYLTGISESEVVDLQEKAGLFIERTESFLRSEGFGLAEPMPHE
jgi:uncharacterized protein (UPF0332 family)